MDISEFTVLIIDDQKSHRFLLGRILHHEVGVKIIEAHDPKEAFEFLKANVPSMIIMDLKLPVMDGVTAIKHIRDDNRLNNIPIVVCSALANKSLVLQLAKLEIADYIVKSSDYEVIKEKLIRVINSIISGKPLNFMMELQEDNQTEPEHEDSEVIIENLKKDNHELRKENDILKSVIEESKKMIAGLKANNEKLVAEVETLRIETIELKKIIEKSQPQKNDTKQQIS